MTILRSRSAAPARHGEGPLPSAPAVRRRVALTREESLHLLASAPFGRIGAVDAGAPVMRPVNHLIVDGCVIVRTRRGSVLAALAASGGAGGVAAAYEADQIDPATHTGCSVIVTGRMSLVADPREAARYRLLLHPWVDQVSDRVLCLRPEAITGVRLTLRAARLEAGVGRLLGR